MSSQNSDRHHDSVEIHQLRKALSQALSNPANRSQEKPSRERSHSASHVKRPKRFPKAAKTIKYPPRPKELSFEEETSIDSFPSSPENSLMPDPTSNPSVRYTDTSSEKRTRTETPSARPSKGGKTIKYPPRTKGLAFEEESYTCEAPRSGNSSAHELLANPPSKGGKTMKQPPRPKALTPEEETIARIAISVQDCLAGRTLSEDGKTIKYPPLPKGLTAEEKRVALQVLSLSGNNSAHELPAKHPSKGKKTMKFPPRQKEIPSVEDPIINSTPKPSKDTFVVKPSFHPRNPSRECFRRSYPSKRPSEDADAMSHTPRRNPMIKQESVVDTAPSFGNDEFLTGPPSNLRLLPPSVSAKKRFRIDASPLDDGKSIELPSRRTLDTDPVIISPKDTLASEICPDPPLDSSRNSSKKRSSNDYSDQGPPVCGGSKKLPTQFKVFTPLKEAVNRSRPIAGPSSNPLVRPPSESPQELSRNEPPQILSLEIGKSVEIPPRPKRVKFSEESVGQQGSPLSKNPVNNQTRKITKPNDVSEIQPQTPTRQKDATSSDESIIPASPLKITEVTHEESDPRDDSIIPLTKRQALPTNKNPNFVRDYFSQSRLHFIGSFRARYESMIGDIAKKLKVPASSLLLPSPPAPVAHRVPGVRTIVHIDMDCFFASVAMASNKSLGGKPIAVCHGRTGSNGSGEISSCSYEARKYGVKAGMFFHQAKKLCPDLISVPYEFPKYEAASFAMYIRFYSLPGVIVEALSVDEAYLDFTNSPDPDVDAVVRKLRADILKDTGCNTSAGIGPNKLCARLATSHAKPNGQHHISEAGVHEFLKNLPIGKIPGIGRKTRRKFEDFGVHTGGHLYTLGLNSLQEMHGEKQGKIFYKMARGVDDSPVEPMKPRKSIGAEISWGVRFTNGQDEAEKCNAFLRDLAAEVCERVLAAGAIGKKVLYKVYESKNVEGPMKYLGHGPCNIYTKSFWIDRKVSKETLLQVLQDVIIKMHRELRVIHTNLRGVGLQVIELEFEKLPGMGEKGGHTAKIKSYFPPNKQERTLFDAIPLNAEAQKPKKKTLVRPKLQKNFEFKKKRSTDIPSGCDEETFKELPEWMQKELIMNAKWKPHGPLTLDKCGADGRARATAAKASKAKKQTQLTFKPKRR